MEEPQRYIFISRRTPTYENVYRPQKVESRERKSITARLLSGKLYVKICYIFCIYSTISRGTPDDVLWNPRVPWKPGWETLLWTICPSQGVFLEAQRNRGEQTQTAILREGFEPTIPTHELSKS
jgi:hypothetical protein